MIPQSLNEIADHMMNYTNGNQRVFEEKSSVHKQKISKAKNEKRVYSVESIIQAQKILKKDNIILSPLLTNYEPCQKTNKQTNDKTYSIYGMPEENLLNSYNTLELSLPLNKYTIDSKFADCVVYLSHSQKKKVDKVLDKYTIFSNKLSMMKLMNSIEPLK